MTISPDHAYRIVGRELTEQEIQELIQAEQQVLDERQTCRRQREVCINTEPGNSRARCLWILGQIHQPICNVSGVSLITIKTNAIDFKKAEVCVKLLGSFSLPQHQANAGHV
ncbi:hypothetical protein [Burkholderia alba]|uniref:hypothetical protein n=1 Tax=Burkholderia alba TaxID=2683677 RepID=UPI002B058B35|nr:hypothetical protein [Burkholderia alba]